MPVLAFLSLGRDIKALRELIDLFLQLDDKSELCGDAEVSHNQITQNFKEGVSSEFLLVPPILDEVFMLDRRNLHDVPDVQG